MNKTTALITLIALVVAFVVSSTIVTPQLGAFVPSLSFLTEGSVGDAIGMLLTTLLSSFLGLSESLAGPLVDVLLML